MKRKLFSLILIISIFTLILAACQTNSNDVEPPVSTGPTSTDETSATPDDGGNGTEDDTAIPMLLRHLQNKKTSSLLISALLD